MTSVGGSEGGDRTFRTVRIAGIGVVCVASYNFQTGLGEGTVEVETSFAMGYPDTAAQMRERFVCDFCMR